MFAIVVYQKAKYFCALVLLHFVYEVLVIDAVEQNGNEEKEREWERMKRRYIYIYIFRAFLYVEKQK